MRRNKREGGQSLVEFALVLPIFMLFLGGIIQFGMIFWGQEHDESDRARCRSICRYRDRLYGRRRGGYQYQDRRLGRGDHPGWHTDRDECDMDVDGSDVDARYVSHQEQRCRLGDGQLVRESPIFFPWLPGNGTVSSSAQYRVEPVTP